LQQIVQLLQALHLRALYGAGGSLSSALRARNRHQLTCCCSAATWLRLAFRACEMMRLTRLKTAAMRGEAGGVSRADWLARGTTDLPRVGRAFRRGGANGVGAGSQTTTRDAAGRNFQREESQRARTPLKAALESPRGRRAVRCHVPRRRQCSQVALCGVLPAVVNF